MVWFPLWHHAGSVQRRASRWPWSLWQVIPPSIEKFLERRSVAIDCHLTGPHGPLGSKGVGAPGRSLSTAAKDQLLSDLKGMVDIIQTVRELAIAVQGDDAAQQATGVVELQFSLLLHGALLALRGKPHAIRVCVERN